FVSRLLVQKAMAEGHENGAKLCNHFRRLALLNLAGPRAQCSHWPLKLGSMRPRGSSASPHARQPRHRTAPGTRSVIACTKHWHWLEIAISIVLFSTIISLSHHPSWYPFLLRKHHCHCAIDS